jgi:hypothetical protein
VSRGREARYLGALPLVAPETDVIEELVVLVCGRRCETAVGQVVGVDKRERGGGRDLLVAVVERVVDASTSPVRTEKRFVVVTKEPGI